MTSHLDRRAGQLVSLGRAAGGDDDLLDDRALSEWLMVNEQWAAQQRHRVRHGKMDPRDAPPYVALSPRRLRYKRSAVLRWLESRTVGGDGGRFTNLGKPADGPQGAHLRPVETQRPGITMPELAQAIRAAPAQSVQRFKRGN